MESKIKMEDNVIFYHLSDINLSRSRWLLSFVIDLSPYEKFLARLESDISNALQTSIKVMEQYSIHSNANDSYLDIFNGLNNELLNVKELHHEIKASYLDYKTLHLRKKRSILPFVGSLLSTLFGTVSEADLDDIRQNIATLANNQAQMSHVLNRSLTVININQMEIRENRQSINGIIDSLKGLDKKIDKIAEEVLSQLNDLKQFTYTFSKLELVVGEINAAIQRALYYYTHLQIQLNALSLQKLSPNLISPFNLRLILGQIADKLPENIGLPSNLDSGLWDYYKHISCLSFIDAQKLIIVAEIPFLVDYTQNFELYKTYSVPSPLTGNFTFAGTDLLGYYKIESDYFAINHRRTRYVFMNENQVQGCYTSYSHVCKIREPQYPTTDDDRCLPALFLGNNKGKRRNCKQYTKPTILPKAIHFGDDLYLVLTKERMKIFITCSEDNSKREIKIDPPVGVLQLSRTCVATSNHLMLVGYYENKMVINVEDSAVKLLRDYKFDASIWKNFNKVAPASTSNTCITISIPKRLRPLPEIPMDDLIRDIEKLQQIKKEKKKFPIWGYLLIVLGLMIAFLIAKWFYKKFLRHRLPNCCSNTAQRPNRTIRQTARFKAIPPGRAGAGSDSEMEVRPSVLREDETRLQEIELHRSFPPVLLNKAANPLQPATN